MAWGLGNLNVESLKAGNGVGSGTADTIVEANKAVGHGPAGGGASWAVEALNLAQNALDGVVAVACGGHTNSLAHIPQDKGASVGTSADIQTRDKYRCASLSERVCSVDHSGDVNEKAVSLTGA